ncbi:MAG: DUF1802 family protein [Planctomycetota bacterium]
MRGAFKEWAVVCQALASGRQILILRKGGIIEDGGAFRVEYPQFLLFPTFLHQKPEGIRPDASPLWTELASHTPSEGTVRISHYAEITDAVEIHDEVSLARVRDEHIWSDDLIAERFHRWQKDQVHALLVRVHALSRPREIAMRDSYGGCKSWIELEEDITTENAVPILADEAYDTRAAKVRDSLGIASSATG